MSQMKMQRKKFLPILLVALLMTAMLLAAVLPVCGMDLSADMVDDLQSFVATDANGVIDRADLGAFVQTYLADQQQKGDEGFTETKIKALEALLLDADDQVDYDILVDLFKKDAGEAEAVTIQTVLTTLDKLTDVDDLTAFVQARQAVGGQIPAYAVAWVVDGVTVKTDTYRAVDTYTYPTVAELNMGVGEYMVWQTGAFFTAPANSAETTQITGVKTNLMAEVAHIVNTQATNLAMDAVVDSQAKVLMLSLPDDPTKLMDLYADFLDTDGKGEVSADKAQMIYSLLSVGMSAGVNTLSIDGKPLLTVADYEINALFDTLKQVAEGDVDALLNTATLADLLTGQTMDFAQMSNMTTVTVGGVDCKSFDSYEITLQTGNNRETWTVHMGFEGEARRMVQIAKWMSELMTTEVQGNETTWKVSLTNLKMQLLLEQVMKSDDIPADVKAKIVCIKAENPADDDIYLFHDDMTIADMVSILRHGNYEGILSAVSGEAVTVEDKEAFNRVLDEILSHFPDSWSDKTLADLYRGNSKFFADATKSRYYVGDSLKRMLGGYTLSMAGFTLSSDVVADAVTKALPYDEYQYNMDVTVENYYLYQVKAPTANGETVTASGFAPAGKDIAILNELFPEGTVGKEGHDTITSTGTITPAGDMTGDDSIEYEYEPRKHTLTIELTYTDANGVEQTVTIEEDVPYGTTLDEDYIKDLLSDTIPVPEGYEMEIITSPDTMPDGGQSITVVYKILNYIIKFVHDGKVIQESAWAYGSIPAYGGATPHKENTNQYEYVFVGFGEILPVTGEATYTAQFIETLRKYTVSFHLPSGEVFATRVASYGETVADFPADPTKDATAEWKYTFSHWAIGDEDGTAFDSKSAVTYTTELYPVFAAEKRSYTVTWIVGNVEYEKIYEYGATPIFEGSTDKEADAQYTYTFSQWEPEMTAVTGNVTYIAQYEQVTNKYKVTFKDYNGDVIAEVEVAYGKDAELPTDPTRADDDENTYTFAGWDSEGYKNVTQDVIITATYTSTPLPPPVEDTEGETQPETEPETEPESECATEAETLPETEVETIPETEAETVAPADTGCNQNVWWILVLVIAIVLILALIGFILYQRGVFAKEEIVEEVVEDIPEVVPVVEEPKEEIHYVQEVSADEVDDLMSDKLAGEVLEESTKTGGAGKVGIINIGVLHGAFEAGDVVNLAILKEKNMIDSNVGRLKVLASGSLDKPLTVEADAFSVQAIKMIILTGGHAVKLKPRSKK